MAAGGLASHFAPSIYILDSILTLSSTGDHVGDFKAFSPLTDQYRVLSYDMRGHGRSSEIGPFTFQQLVDDIEGLRLHFLGQNGRLIVLGGSFGGYLAQQYAIQYSQHVSHLILRGTAPSYHRESYHL